jgi:hypothetical protein
MSQRWRAISKQVASEPEDVAWVWKWMGMPGHTGG